MLQQLVKVTRPTKGKRDDKENDGHPEHRTGDPSHADDPQERYNHRQHEEAGNKFRHEWIGFIRHPTLN